MTDLSFRCEWLAAGQDAAPFRETTGQLTIGLGGVSLTQNEDVWSKTVRDSVLVSAYPLAAWLAASWWRLSYEPMPKHGGAPTVDWRMSHEMGAANSGFVWPNIVLASDGEALQIWAQPASAHSKQSVRYLAGLSGPRAVSLASFQQSASEFINMVTSRLVSMGQTDTDLANLWQLVLADQADPDMAKVRRIEAQMGYDPDECPAPILDEALALAQRLGTAAMSELAPVFGRRDDGAALGEIAKLGNADGLQGIPAIVMPMRTASSAAAPPWQRAVEAARSVRMSLGNRADRLNDECLYGLLGLSAQAVAKWEPPARHQAAVAVPAGERGLKFVPRKRHPIAKRFEFARFLGDYTNGEPNHWLASTDLATARQKFQRAFAAELLCPIESLVSFLGGDFSEPAVEEAAAQFDVSDKTVESLLANNGYVSPHFDEGGLPYRLAA